MLTTGYGFGIGESSLDEKNLQRDGVNFPLRQGAIQVP